MVDKEIIFNKLNELERYLAALAGFKVFSLKELRESLQKTWSVEHGLQLSIQLVIHIGNHILAAIGENRIAEYTDIIDRLGEKEIIPSSFAADIRDMAGFRNILVHEYIYVDIGQVFHVLQNRLGDFEKFISYIKTYLKSQ